MLTVYTKTTCKHCTATKAYLTQIGVSFKEINIQQVTEAHTFVKSRGHGTVPQIYFGDVLFVEGGNSGLQALSPDQVYARLREFNAL